MIKKKQEESDPFRWTRYNEIMAKRENVNFRNANHCKRCGKPWGNHVTDYVLSQNPNACPFVK